MGNTHGILFVYIFNQLKKTVHTLPGLGGNKNYRGIRHKGKVIHKTLTRAVHGSAVLFDSVPFIHSYNARLSLLNRKTRNL